MIPVGRRGDLARADHRDDSIPADRRNGVARLDRRCRASHHHRRRLASAAAIRTPAVCRRRRRRRARRSGVRRRATVRRVAVDSCAVDRVAVYATAADRVVVVDRRDVRRRWPGWSRRAVTIFACIDEPVAARRSVNAVERRRVVLAVAVARRAVGRGTVDAGAVHAGSEGVGRRAAAVRRGGPVAVAGRVGCRGGPRRKAVAVGVDWFSPAPTAAAVGVGWSRLAHRTIAAIGRRWRRNGWCAAVERLRCRRRCRGGMSVKAGSAFGWTRGGLAAVLPRRRLTALVPRPRVIARPPRRWVFALVTPGVSVLIVKLTRCGRSSAAAGIGVVRQTVRFDRLPLRLSVHARLWRTRHVARVLGRASRWFGIRTRRRRTAVGGGARPAVHLPGRRWFGLTVGRRFDPETGHADRRPGHGRRRWRRW